MQGNWHWVFDSHALPPGASRAFEVQGVAGFAVRVHGRLHAYRNQCPHIGLPLNWQPHEFLAADRHHIVCANHGALFDSASGHCLAGPCAGAGLTLWDIREQSGGIEVSDPPA